ncbi:MAG: hypothetical protein AB1725_06325 [Armatimonadota bacterium]
MNAISLLFMSGAVLASAFGGDGFLRVVYDSHGDVWARALDGSSDVRVTAVGDAQMATLSPDGDWVAFARTGTGTSIVYRIRIDGTELQQVASREFAEPAWSNGGSRIACSGGSPNGRDIYTMNPDGTDIRRLTTMDGWESSPAWSGDDSKIAFVKNHDIYTMNSDGSGVTNVLDDTVEQGGPAFSPDGSLIAFHSARARTGDLHIFVMNSDGSNVRQLTFGTTFDRDPAFTPDGQRIVFSSPREEGTEQLWIVNVDGSGLRRLTPPGPPSRSNPDVGPTVVDIAPESFAVREGLFVSGGVPELLYSDDRHLFIMAQRPPDVASPSIQVEVHGTSPTDAIAKIYLTVEAASTFSIPPQWIDAYDYVSGAWRRLDTRTATTDDSTVTVAISEGAWRFLQPGTKRLSVGTASMTPGLQYRRGSVGLTSCIGGLFQGDGRLWSDPDGGSRVGEWLTYSTASRPSRAG